MPPHFSTTDHCGSLDSQPIELQRQEVNSGKALAAADVWATGAVLYKMVTGENNSLN